MRFAVLAVPISLCPQPAMYVYGETCYKFINKVEPWHTAVVYCQANNATLLDEEAHNQIAYLQLQLAHISNMYIWLQGPS